MDLENLARSVLIVGWECDTYGRKQFVPICSGFVIDSENGLVLTAAHNFAGEQSPRSCCCFAHSPLAGRLIVTTAGGQTKRMYWATMVAFRPPALSMAAIHSAGGSSTSQAYQARHALLQDFDKLYYNHWGCSKLSDCLDVVVLRIDRLYDDNKRPSFPLEDGKGPIPSLPLGGSEQLRMGEDLTVLGIGKTGRERATKSTSLAVTPVFGKFAKYINDQAGQTTVVSMQLLDGHSGAPVLNGKGQVIGIAGELGHGPSDRQAGFAYLVPIHRVLPVLHAVLDPRLPPRIKVSLCAKGRLLLQVHPDEQMGNFVRQVLSTGQAATPDALAPSEASSSMQPPPAKRPRLTASWLRKAADIEWKEELGSGSFGTAYKVISHNQHMAAKKIVITVASERENAMHRLEHEFAALAELEHPNILQPLGAVVDAPGWVALLTELMPEGSLRQMLDNTPATVTEDFAVQLLLARGISSGMAQLHLQGMLHHDLKSANVLLGRQSDGRLLAKVADFGLATSNARSTLHASRVGNHGAATLLYEAPELFHDSLSFQMPCEVYAFAIILWEMVTGEEPWKGMNRTGIVMAVGRDDRRPEFPGEQATAFFAQLAKRCWVKDPDARPSFEQLKRQLLAIPDPIAPRPASQSRVDRLEQRVGTHELSLGMHDPVLVNKVKHASVRIGIYRKDTEALVSLGSGTLIDAGAGAPKGQVLSAAHLFVDVNIPTTLPPYYEDPNIDWNAADAPFVILIGMYQADDRPSRWAFWAELVTPLNVLQMKKSGMLLDLAVLRIRGEIEMRPAEYNGPLLSETYEMVQRTAALSLALPEGIPLGEIANFQTGISKVTVFGWFAPHAEKTLFTPQPETAISTVHGHLITQALLHTAGSGGAQVDSQGHLLAVNSISWPDPTIPMPYKDYKAYGRMVSDLTSLHGLQT